VFAGFETMSLLVGLSLLSSFSQFAVQRADAFNKFVHKLIVHSTNFLDDTPEIETNEMKRIIVEVVRQGWSAPTTTVIHSGDGQAVAQENERNERWAADAALQLLEKVIKPLVQLALVPSSSEKGAAADAAAATPFLLGPYRHLSLQYALDILKIFGQKTAIKKPVPKEMDKEEKKDKEKDDEGEAAEEMDLEKKEADDEGEERKDTRKKKSGQKKAKKESKTEMVWRPEYEAVLDDLCQDKDETIRAAALEVVTRYWC
jgi:hypothetical protein